MTMLYTAAAVGQGLPGATVRPDSSASPAQREFGKGAMAERCKANPQRCEEMKAKMKERHEQCKANPEKCREERKARFEERCKQNPQRCEEMKTRMKERQAQCKTDPDKCGPGKDRRPDGK